MQQINTKVYGTTGLPKFGTGSYDVSKQGNIGELDAAFNQFMGAVKTLSAPGNEIALAEFAYGLKSIYWLAHNCVAGKPVI
jgi:hypothetical protein